MDEESNVNSQEPHDTTTHECSTCHKILKTSTGLKIHYSKVHTKNSRTRNQNTFSERLSNSDGVLRDDISNDSDDDFEKLVINLRHGRAG